MALLHEPLRPPRAKHIGEQVYASMWKAAMAERWEEIHFDIDEPPPIYAVLEELGVKRINQRHATVAATVICWLGCNMGNALVHQARRQIAAGRWEERDAYLLAWTIENRRVGCVNNGVRAIEYMLAPEADYVKNAPLAHSGLSKLPELAAQDLEIVDHVMLWLPTERGQAFLRQCETEIERLHDQERRRKAAEWDRIQRGQA